MIIAKFVKYQSLTDYLFDTAKEEFQTIYDLDTFLGYDKFRDHLELIPKTAKFDLILFDNKGKTENLVNMASLLKSKFPKNEVNLICLDDHLVKNENINQKIISNLAKKGVNLIFNAEVSVETENNTISVKNKQTFEEIIENREIEFLFYSTFRKWPSFLTKSGIYKEDFCQKTLSHKTNKNIFLAGSLINNESSLYERFKQAQTVVENIERKVIKSLII
jgi:hypothetical protein